MTRRRFPLVFTKGRRIQKRDRDESPESLAEYSKKQRVWTGLVSQTGIISQEETRSFADDSGAIKRTQTNISSGCDCRRIVSEGNSVAGVCASCGAVLCDGCMGSCHSCGALICPAHQKRVELKEAEDIFLCPAHRWRAFFWAWFWGPA